MLVIGWTHKLDIGPCILNLDGHLFFVQIHCSGFVVYLSVLLFRSGGGLGGLHLLLKSA